MSPLDLIPVAACLLVAALTSAVLSRYFGAPSERGRFATIDGLRGYLALLVFVHHGAHWFDYSRGGSWIAPSSRLLTNIGPVPVTLFFMITGFLFLRKIGKTASVDWRRLYLHRVFRLTPLYLVAMIAMFAIVLTVSWPIVVTQSDLMRTMGRWLLYTVNGMPRINAYQETSIVTAGVTWSLVFEWFFYFLLPVFALVAHRRVSAPALILATGAAAFVFVGLSDGRFLLGFIGAPIAVYAVQSGRLTKFASTRAASALTLLLLVGALLASENPLAKAPLIMTAGAFALIACGCDVFGCLTTRWSLFLGELAYSIYLLHGMLLFLVFKVLVPSPLSWVAHWAVVVGLVPLVVAGSFLTFRFIEKPGIALGHALDSRLSRRRNQAAAYLVP